MLLKPFSKNETFYRGNLHGHSKHSDGKLTSREVVERYKSLGYDLLAFQIIYGKKHIFLQPQLMIHPI